MIAPIPLDRAYQNGKSIHLDILKNDDEEFPFMPSSNLKINYTMSESGEVLMQRGPGYHYICEGNDLDRYYELFSDKAIKIQTKNFVCCPIASCLA